MTDAPENTERVRAAEIAASLCLATDLGMGFPLEHGLHATLMAVRLAELLGLDAETTNQIYYAAMLMYTGCTVDAVENAQVFAGSRTEHLTPTNFGSMRERLSGIVRAMPPPRVGSISRTIEIARRIPRAMANATEHFTAMCEVAEMLCRRLGLPSEVYGLFPFLTERWDGSSVLRRAKEDDVPLPLRVVHVAHDAAYQRYVYGRQHARETVAARAGAAFDPGVASRFVDEADEVSAATDAGDSAWSDVLAAEPHPELVLTDEEIDRALRAMGDFADLVSPSLAGHSAGLAGLVSRAAEIAGLPGNEITAVRRAAHLHDIGRIAIHVRIWEKPGPLTPDEREQVRLHAYHTERVMRHSPFLREIADIAGNHHERLDGSGYHRGVGASSLDRRARLLAAADVFHAMTEPRAHRAPFSPEEAASKLAEMAGDGRLDPEAVESVIKGAGEPAPEIARPAGLTPREAEVLGLIARGLQTKQVAARLDISKKTADTHIQNAYRKIGVSTRAAATLYAMEHGLVPRGSTPL